nr:hypothetical protein [Tanacetum cinerariifolium]
DDEEEEHPASADSIPPPPALHVTARISFRPQPPTLSFTKEDARLSIVHRPGYEAGESSAAAVTRPIEGRRADYGFVGSVEAEIRRKIAEDIGYGIRDAWIDPRDIAEEEALTTLEGVNTRVTELAADQRIDAQDTLIATLTTQLSSLHGHLVTALGEIQALQAREQARASTPEGAGSST